MESGEETGKWIRVEAKTFSCSPSPHGFILKESHKLWERNLILSLDQATWISKGLLLRNSSFGATRRKESKVFNGSEVVLVEGSNSKGIYLSIQICVGRSVTAFLVVPAGRNGTQWRRVANLIGQVINGDAGRCESTPISPQETRRISYAAALLGNSLPTPNSASLQSRIETLEDKVHSVLVHLGLNISESHNRENAPIRYPLSMAIDRLERVMTESIEAFRSGSSGTMTNRVRNSVARDNRDSPFGSDLPISTARNTCDPSNGLSHSISSTERCDLFFNYSFPSSPSTGTSQLTLQELIGSMERPNIDSLNVCSSSTDSNNEKIADSITGSIDTDDTDDTEENSTKGDTDAITWDDVEESFVHENSGMRFHPHSNVFYTWVSPLIADDLRRLYYEPVNGVLTLTQHGQWGILNNTLLMEDDWDRDMIYSEKDPCFYQDLFDCFRVVIDEYNSSSSSP